MASLKVCCMSSGTTKVVLYGAGTAELPSVDELWLLSALARKGYCERENELPASASESLYTVLSEEETCVWS